MTVQATTEPAARQGGSNGDSEQPGPEGPGAARRQGGRQWLARNFGWFRVDLGLAQVAAPRGLARTIVVRGEQAGAQPRPAAVEVTKAITIKSPVEQVYGFWRDFKQLPRFMAHLEGVEVIDERRSHWIVKAPTGALVEWDAEIVEDVPNQLIAWRAVEGADVAGSSSVQLARAPGNRGTEVRVTIRYDAPSSRLAATIARLFGTALGLQAENDLRRLKQILELGEIVHSDASIHADLRPHPARPAGEDGASAAAAAKPGGDSVH